MRLAEAASPPTGYLDFCQRQPEDCGGAPAAVVRKVAEIELSRRNAAEARYILAGGRPTTTGSVQSRSVNWSNTFAEARRRREMAEQSNAAIDAAMSAALTPASMSSTGLTLVSAPRGAEEVKLERLAHRAAPMSPEPARQTSASQAVEPARPAMTPALWSTLTKINDKVNREIQRRSDIQVYGVIDRWATPLQAGSNLGDCEDYVLEKRRALIAAGLPESALSIAVANTSWGESHAVLLVATDQGDYVLDSLTPWILPWRKASLTWRERQVGGAPFRWAMVNTGQTAEVLPAPSPPAPAAATTTTPRDVRVEAPPRLLRTEAFTGRPIGVEGRTPTAPAAADEPASVITIAQLGGGGPLRGRLH